MSPVRSIEPATAVPAGNASFALTRRVFAGLLVPAVIGMRRAFAATSETPMFAGTRLHWPMMNTTLKMAGRTAIITQISAGAPPYQTYDLQLFLPSFYTINNGSTSPERYAPNPLAVYGVTVEYGGKYYPVTFSGARSVLLSNTTGSGVLSDPVAGLAMPPNATYRVRTLTAHSLNDIYIGGYRLQTQNGEGYRHGATAESLVPYLTGGAITGGAAGVSYVYGPAYAVAKGWDGRPVFLLTGDSIGWGANEDASTPDARGNFGFLMRGCDDAVGSVRSPYGTICIPGLAPGDQSKLSSSGGRFAGIAAAGRPFTHILDEMGTNGIGGGPTSYEKTVWPDMCAWQERLGAHFPGAPRIKTTFFPRVKTTPDNFTSVDGQKPSAISGDDYGTGSRYRMINDIRSFRGGYWQNVVDVLPYGMDPRVPGSWAVPPFRTSLLAAMSQTTLTCVTADAPPPGTVLVLDPGGANVDRLQVTGVSGSGPFKVQFGSYSAAAHSAGARCAAAATTDGTHPSAAVHTAAAVAVARMKNTV